MSIRQDSYFLAYAILMAQVGVILNPCSEFLASLDCISVSNSTKAMSLLPGTSRTSLKPGNLKEKSEGRYVTRKTEVDHGRRGRRGGNTVEPHLPLNSEHLQYNGQFWKSQLSHSLQYLSNPWTAITRSAGPFLAFPASAQQGKL